MTFEYRDYYICSVDYKGRRELYSYHSNGLLKTHVDENGNALKYFYLKNDVVSRL